MTIYCDALVIYFWPCYPPCPSAPDRPPRRHDRIRRTRSDKFCRRSATLATVIPIRNFFRPPSFERPQVNPCGSQLAAFVELEDNHTAALLVDLKSGKKITIKVGADRDIDRIDWLDNRYLLLWSSQSKVWADALFVVDTENPDQVHAIERNSVVKLVGIPTHSPMKPVFWIRQDATPRVRWRGRTDRRHEFGRRDGRDGSDVADRNRCPHSR